MNEHLAHALLDVLIFWTLTTPHEFAHAWVATKLGDDTPRRDGRVTLNPLAHVDWFGTVIIPLVTSLMGGGFLGWGRPVMTDPRKLRGGKYGMALVALAGPMSNLVFAGGIVVLANLLPNAVDILFRAVYLSIYLALFNLIPLPCVRASGVAHFAHLIWPTRILLFCPIFPVRCLASPAGVEPGDARRAAP